MMTNIANTQSREPSENAMQNQTHFFLLFFCDLCAPTEECSKEDARTLVSSVYVTQVFSPLYARISLQS